MKKKLRLRNKFIPVNIPKLSNQEKINVKKCLSTGWNYRMTNLQAAIGCGN